MLGRIANFINGELLGREYPVPTTASGPWWTVKFPQEVLVGDYGLPPRTPDEREAIWKIIEGAGITDGRFEYAYQKLLDKIQHGRHDLQAQLEPLIHARYPSQLMQAFAEGIVLGLTLWLIARWPHRPGILGCWFLVIYGILRILTEVWRLPDAQFANGRPYGLSRGQWLSAFMIAFGLGAMLWLMKQGGRRMGGWGRKAA
jgi:phosphatidylglycerol:prolipoprotein diacylglycerol transferase